MIDVEAFQKRVSEQRQRFDTIVAWHLLAYVKAGIELPPNGDDTYRNMNVYADPNDYTSREIDIDATLVNLAKVAKFATEQGHKVEKDYSSDFTVKVTLRDEYPRIVVRYFANRDAVCTKKVTGTRVVPAQTYPERVEEIVEWECEKISLLAVDTETETATL